MHRKLTITVDSRVYAGLRRVIGPRRISQFIEELVRPHVLGSELESEYAAMAADEARERGAQEWADALVGDVSDDTR